MNLYQSEGQDRDRQGKELADVPRPVSRNRSTILTPTLGMCATRLCYMCLGTCATLLCYVCLRWNLTLWKAGLLLLRPSIFRVSRMERPGRCSLMVNLSCEDLGSQRIILGLSSLSQGLLQPQDFVLHEGSRCFLLQAVET